MSRKCARGIIVSVCALLVARSALAGLPDEVYTLRKLLSRSVVIAVGEVMSLDGVVAKTAVSEGNLKLSAVIKGEIEPGSVEFKVGGGGPPLPVGAKALWFLQAPDEDGVYAIDHPQCAYDVTHRTILETAIKDPGRIRPGYYLRREDERLHDAVKEAKERRQLRDLAAGASKDGLELKVKVSSRSPRAGHGLTVDFTLTNRSKKPLQICDSSAECYFIRAKGPLKDEVEVGRAGAEDLDFERALGLGSLISEHDFVELAPGGSHSRTLSVSTKVISALNQSGKLLVSGVYRYRNPPQPLVKLPQDPWVGAVASPAVEVVLAKPLEVK